MYCAVIADILNSRKIKNREETQKNLEGILEQVNKKYADDIAAKFVITIGDEFQGLLNSPARLLEIIDYIKMNFYPMELRFGIGIGKISTQINREMAIGADGPAYYSARRAVEEVKENEKKNERPESDMIICQTGCDGSNYDLINSSLSLCRYIENRWTDKQRQVIQKMMEYSLSQKELARELGLAQSSIQRRIDASGYYSYIEAKRNIMAQIMRLWEETDD